MISQEEKLFRLDDKKRAVLIDFLSNPIVSTAFSILTQVPTREPAFVPGVALDTTIAHEYCKMLGANSVMRGMIRMTHVIDKSPEEMEDKGEEQPFAYLEDRVQPMAPPAAPVPPEIDPPARTKRAYNRKKK